MPSLPKVLVHNAGRCEAVACRKLAVFRVRIPAADRLWLWVCATHAAESESGVSPAFKKRVL